MEYSKELVEFCNKFYGDDKKISPQTIKFRYNNELNLLLKETSFLEDDKPSLRRRMWHIVNNIKTVPLCLECRTNKVKWKKKSYAKFCSPKCSSLNQEVQEKSKKTCIQKYGVERVLQSQEILNKSKETCLRKYGVESVANVDSVKELKRKTLLERYGVEHYSKTSEYKQKVEKTNREKIGRSFHKQKHISTCSLEKLNNRDWLFEQHYIKKRFLIDIAEELNVSDGTVGNYLLRHGMITQHQNFSRQEKTLAEFIQKHYPNAMLNYKLLGRKEVDIFIPEKNLAIEYNGLYHHCSLNKPKNYHRQKYILCKNAGIRLLSIFEDEWIYKEALVKSKLLHILGISSEEKIYARKCVVDTPTTSERKYFLDQYHIQGDGKGSVSLCLKYYDDIVAIMTFIKRETLIYELNRYATKYVIVGGFSKLLKHFKNNFRFKEIITFTDLRWHTGSVYEQNGFIFDKELQEDYEYVFNKKRFHKFNYRKKNIKKLYPLEYDDSLSEKALMEKINIPRIYDCGKLRFVLKNKEV